MDWHFVLDEFGDLPSRVNHDLVEIQPVAQADDMELLKTMIERHYERTGSRRAQELLGAWEEALPKFQKVVPRAVHGIDGRRGSPPPPELARRGERRGRIGARRCLPQRADGTEPDHESLIHPDRLNSVGELGVP